MNWLRIASLISVTALSLGCVVFFEGTVAELEDAPGLSVEMTSQSYGDCFRVGLGVPTVYKLVRPNYTVNVAHGMRYWPEFFLSAHDLSGTTLNITGPGISPVTAPTGGDMRRLREARQGVELNQHVLLDIPRGYDASTGQWLAVQAVRENTIGLKRFTFEIRNSRGLVGTEELSYRVKTIRCREYDGP